MTTAIKTTPFHSPRSTHYHDNTGCPVGQKIVSDRIYSTDDKPHCPTCGALNAAPQDKMNRM